ncbi:hypothetical protein GCM10010388_22020 [Streptomyces mauvecolor]
MAERAIPISSSPSMSHTASASARAPGAGVRAVLFVEIQAGRHAIEEDGPLGRERFVGAQVAMHAVAWVRNRYRAAHKKGLAQHGRAGMDQPDAVCPPGLDGQTMG